MVGKGMWTYHSANIDNTVNIRALILWHALDTSLFDFEFTSKALKFCAP